MLSISLSAVALLLSFYFIRSVYAQYKYERALSAVPTHEFSGTKSHERYVRDYAGLLRSGYIKYNKAGRAFKVRGSSGDWIVIVPRQHLDQVKNASGNTLSWEQQSRDVFLTKYTGVPDHGAWLGRVVRTELNKRLDGLTSVMIEEMTSVMERTFGNDTETPMTMDILSTISAIVAQVTVRVFCGGELAKDPDWVQAAVKFTANGFGSAQDLKTYPAWCRYAVSFFLDSVRQVSADKRLARRKLEPLFLNKIAALQGEKTSGAARERIADDDGLDGLDWFIHGAGGASINDMVDSTIRAMMASIHTTAQTATICMVELLRRPDMLRELREEAITHLSPCTTPRDIGLACDKLRKMDSFLKESARCNPVLTLTVGRKVQKKHVLPDGVVLPPGTSIFSPPEAVFHDPDLYPDPDRFDGLRFYKLRQRETKDDKHWLFSAANEESLLFGIGVQSCPGRWFAAREILLLMSKLLLDYNIVYEPRGKEDATFKRSLAMMAPPKGFRMVSRKRTGKDCMFPSTASGNSA